MDGVVEGTIRYKKNGKYIDIAPDGSINGYHYGMRIGNQIYDNLTLAGMKFQDWLADFGGDMYVIWDPVKDIISH